MESAGNPFPWKMNCLATFQKRQIIERPTFQTYGLISLMWKVGCLQSASFIWAPVFSTYIRLLLGLTILRSPLQTWKMLPFYSFQPAIATAKLRLPALLLLSIFLVFQL